MGVWIEISSRRPSAIPSCSVTPFMGVWIEIFHLPEVTLFQLVTPFMGVWIEILSLNIQQKHRNVTPFMGVWIEIFSASLRRQAVMSHPLWVCGLKFSMFSPGFRIVTVTPFMGVWIEITTWYTDLPG